VAVQVDPSDHFAAGLRAAGIGSLMRTLPAAVHFSSAGDAQTEDLPAGSATSRTATPPPVTVCVI
jgi:hypothetical protein